MVDALVVGASVGRLKRGPHHGRLALKLLTSDLQLVAQGHANAMLEARPRRGGGGRLEVVQALGGAFPVGELAKDVTPDPRGDPVSRDRRDVHRIAWPGLATISNVGVPRSHAPP